MSSTGNAELRTQAKGIVKKLNDCKIKLKESEEKGRKIADMGDDDTRGEMEWRVWTTSLPPIAFDVARETKELLYRVEIIDGAGREEEHDNEKYGDKYYEKF